MPHLFENLLVSSPNGGGLLFIHQDQAFLLDNINTTGISLSGTTLLRGLQPQGLALYKGHRAEQYDAPHIHDIHDVLIAEPYLYAVGTTANEILQLDEDAGEIHRWTLEGEKDAKHLNCLALWNQRIVFCAFGDFTEHRQYKDKTEQAGFVQDLHSGERLITGLSQPHSLFAVGKHLLLANSETKELREYDSRGTLLRSKTLDGYTRGICVHNGRTYIGLSRSRNIGDDCLSSARLVALDSQSWQELGHIDLPVSEVYSIHGIKNPDLIPALLAGISQHASARHQQSLNERDTQLQKLVERTAQLELLNMSFEEQLHQQNKQHHDTLSHSLQVQAQQLMQLADEKSAHENLRQEFIAQEQRHKQLIEQLTLGQQVKNHQLESTVAMLTDRNTELTEMSQRYETSHRQYQQILDKLDTALTLLTKRDSDLAALSQRYEKIHHQHQQLLNSNSWLLTQPIRNIRRWLRL